MRIFLQVYPAQGYTYPFSVFGKLFQVLDRELREKHWSAWLKGKSKQFREERELKQRQEAERTYFTIRHTKNECDRAFHE